MFHHMLTPIRLTLAAASAIALLHAAPALAQQAAEVHLTYSSGAFQPNEVRAPADRPVVFRVQEWNGRHLRLIDNHRNRLRWRRRLYCANIMKSGAPTRRREG